MSIRSACLVAFAAFTLVTSDASAQAARVTLITSRYASSAGLGDLVGFGNIYAGAFGLTSATRPNGQSNWNFQNQSLAGLTYVGDATGLDDWMSSNARGAFTIQGAPAGPQNITSFTVDTTPYYTAPSAQNCMELTQESISLFESIRANGLTGTFTFFTTQTVSEAAYGSVDMYLGQYSRLGVLSGNSFAMTITAALSQSDTLYIRPIKTTIWQPAGPFVDVSFSMSSGTIYGATPVPAPGAIALLGLAGLAKRRRR